MTSLLFVGLDEVDLVIPQCGRSRASDHASDDDTSRAAGYLRRPERVVRRPPL